MAFLLHQVRFNKTVSHISDLPTNPQLEVAFVGRSNAGKSTAINVLCNQKNLAFVSKTPGRTKNINYFLIGPETNPVANIVDLPGYGYAKVSTSTKVQLEILLSTYLSTRSQIRGLILIVDSRRYLTDIDRKMIELLVYSGKRTHMLLAKCDKLSRQECINILSKIENELNITYHHNDMVKGILTAQLFSAKKRIGLKRLHSLIENWIN